MSKEKTGVEQADGHSYGNHKGSYHGFLKKLKARFERRKAKLNPQSAPTYGKYEGWEL